MTKAKTTNYRDIQNQVLKIFQSRDLIAKAALCLGLVGTGFALILLVIKAFFWLIIFAAGVVLLSYGMHRGSSSSSSSSS